MSGSKAPDLDTYGLLRATHYHNPTQYSHIVGLSSHFYAPTYEQAHVGLDLLTLVSLKFILTHQGASANIVHFLSLQIKGSMLY